MRNVSGNVKILLRKSDCRFRVAKKVHNDINRLQKGNKNTRHFVMESMPKKAKIGCQTPLVERKVIISRNKSLCNQNEEQ